MSQLLHNVLVPIFICFTFNLTMLPIYWAQHPFFEQFKIQKDKAWPWLSENKHVRDDFWMLSIRSVKLASVNLFILLPMMSAMKIWIVKVIGLENPNAFSTDEAHWPTSIQNVQDLLLMVVLHELGFYMTHKMMHIYPSLYKYHKIHHEYKMNTTIASQHNHPIDFILSIGGPALLAVAVVHPHMSTLFQFTIWSMFANLDDHLGYAFPWSPVRWFVLSAATEEHEFHHSKNVGCYASKLSIFNTLFGGYEHYNNKKTE